MTAREHRKPVHVHAPGPDEQARHRSGLIRQLTVNVLGAARAQAAAWRREGLDLKVAVNLPMHSLHELSLCDDVAQLLHEHDVPASTLVLEITEDKIAIVRATVTLAHELGLVVVAEGVEDLESWTSLKDLGCDVAQGYLLSRPLSAPDLTEWVARRGRVPMQADPGSLRARADRAG